MYYEQSGISKPNPFQQNSKNTSVQNHKFQCITNNPNILIYPTNIDYAPQELEIEYCQNRIYNSPNSGGKSVISESVASGILKKHCDFELLKIETEIKYKYDCNGVTHVDFVGIMNEKITAVSVTKIPKIALESSTILQAMRETNYDEIEERIYHKCRGFKNVDFEYFTRNCKTKTYVDVINGSDKVYNEINLIMIFIDQNMIDIFKKVISEYEMKNYLKNMNIKILLIPTDSAFIMYEPKNISMTKNMKIDEYVAFYVNNVKKKQTKNQQEKLLRSIIRQSQRYDDFINAVQLAKTCIIKKVSRHEAKEIFKKDGKCDLLTWAFVENNTNGIFGGYFISSLIYLKSVMKDMNHIIIEEHNDLISVLEKYYNRHCHKFKAVYTKGSTKLESGEVLLTGTISLVKKIKVKKLK